MVTSSEYTIASLHRETPDTVSFVLKGAPLEHKAGQFVMLEYPVVEAEANDPKKPIKRAYSIASSPSRGKKGEIKLCVKEMPNGLISKLLQKVTKSSCFMISGPFGGFVFDPKEHKDIVMISAGSGIAPFASFLEQIKDEKLDTKACLIFSNKTEEDIICRKWLDELAENCQNAEVHYTLTRCPETIPKGEDVWCGKKGRIDSKMLETVCGNDLASKDFFLCGPLVFVKSMRELLAELSVDKEKIHFESYG